MTRLTLLRVLGAWTTVALVGGCGVVGPDVDGLDEEIARHRRIWDARRPATYTYEVERQCYCPEEARGPVRMTVQGSAVSDRVYSQSGLPVPAHFTELFPTVDGLFDLLEEAVARPADRIDVTWDPDTGVPVEFFIDYAVNAADEELGFRIVARPSQPGG